MCTNVCITSCSNGCGPMSNCGGHCTSSTCGGTCRIGGNYYCLYNNCGFNCGGDNTIETSLTDCSGQCSSSSCSATGRNIFLN